MLDPSTMSALGSGMDVFGRVFGAIGAYQEGRAAEVAAKHQAAQLRQNAGQAMAASQRDAITAEEQTKRIASRALAVAAASGGGASDPTVVSLIAGIAQEGAYRQAVALYGGQERASAMEMQADMTEHEGRLAKRVGTRNAIGGLLMAGSAATKGAARGQSLYDKYGAGGPGGANG